MDVDKPVELAAVTGAHGVTGEVRLKLLGGGIDVLRTHASFNAGEGGRTLTLVKIRSDNKGGAIARFAEAGSRAEAEALRGTVLTIPRLALPPLEEGEYYHADLIGLAVVTDVGEAVGKVIAVHNFGATDIIEIQKPDGKTFMVPMTVQAVPGWDAESLAISGEFVDR
ncbi:MAG: ribosome maturation factor RimM [Sphingomonadales bacterium BRH_c42]|nr:MAG: ribosome maturation factor RimM [Sphingomonadales bacterium BRH_c42]